jgi:hypothetical protein
VNSDGTFPVFENHPGFSAVSHTGTGIYTLAMTNFPAIGNNLMVTIGLGGIVGGQTTWRGSPTPNALEIRTYDAAGNPQDRAFTVVAFDTTP